MAVFFNIVSIHKNNKNWNNKNGGLLEQNIYVRIQITNMKPVILKKLLKNVKIDLTKNFYETFFKKKNQFYFELKKKRLIKQVQQSSFKIK